MCSIIKFDKFVVRILVVIVCFLSLTNATKYAGEFQELIAGGRSCGMGGTGIAQGIDPAAILLNPANAPFISRSVHFMHAENFSGLIKNEFGALVVPKINNAYGIGFQMVSASNIKLTTLPDTTRQPGDENQPIPYDTVAARDMILYFNAAKSKNIFACGLNVKIYYRDLAVLTGLGGGVDLGVKVNLKNLNAGFTVRDFILSPIYWDNDSKEYVSPKITFGLAPYIPLISMHSAITIEVDLVKDLSFDELKLNAGIEWAYQNKIYGRLGKSGGRYTAGAGLRYKRLVFDYGLITHSDLGLSNKFSAGLVF